GAQHVIDVLRGSANERVRRWGHDRLSTHGIGLELDAQGWRSVLRQLVARGLLALDPGGYGGLRLTDAALPVLRGEEELRLRRDVLTRAKTGGGADRKRRGARLALTAAAGDLADDPHEPATLALFERLRARRRELAEEQGVPPYVIFHDKTLAAMASRRPVTDEMFLSISGVGERKLERYGETFMALIRDESAVAEALEAE
ncbi:HRDC domain-containing protein, partial [bacterium]|nr:HRDC domain-containing protein [bacterium]